MILIIIIWALSSSLSWCSSWIGCSRIAETCSLSTARFQRCWCAETVAVSVWESRDYLLSSSLYSTSTAWAPPRLERRPARFGAAEKPLLLRNSPLDSGRSRRSDFPFREDSKPDSSLIYVNLNLKWKRKKNMKDEIFFPLPSRVWIANFERRCCFFFRKRVRLQELRSCKRPLSRRAFRARYTPEPCSLWKKIKISRIVNNVKK